MDQVPPSFPHEAQPGLEILQLVTSVLLSLQQSGRTFCDLDWNQIGVGHAKGHKDANNQLVGSVVLTSVAPSCHELREAVLALLQQKGFDNIEITLEETSL